MSLSLHERSCLVLTIAHSFITMTSTKAKRQLQLSKDEVFPVLNDTRAALPQAAALAAASPAFWPRRHCEPAENTTINRLDLVTCWMFEVLISSSAAAADTPRDIWPHSGPSTLLRPWKADYRCTWDSNTCPGRPAPGCGKGRKRKKTTRLSVTCSVRVPRIFYYSIP